MLRDMARYIEERGEVPLRDIALHFGLSPEAAEPMADRLAGKERIEKVEVQEKFCAGCGRCAKADRANRILYRCVASRR